MINNNISFDIASLFSHDKATLDLIDSLKELDIELPIKSVHGSPSVLWHGGRNIDNIPRISDTHINEIFNTWSDRGIGMYLTFSNWYLTKEHLKNVECNELLEKLSEIGGDVGIIVVSDILQKYVRKNYPKIKIKSSIDKVVMDSKAGNLEYYKKLLDTFDIVNLHTDDGHNKSLLKSLSGDCDRIEIIVNEPCIQKCPYRKKEHSLFSKALHKDVGDISGTIKCNTYRNVSGKQTEYSFFSRQEMKETTEMGYSLFKLQGRTTDWNIYKEMLKFYMLDELLEFYLRLNEIERSHVDQKVS
jgi:collagenase-like PrtC family protease